MSIFTPQNQVKLTNVSIVRLKKGGKRFELACYKNKVLEWRRGITTQLDEVLQSESIFSNVSKGQVAKREDLVNCFKSDNEAEIRLEILTKGELQVSEKERSERLNELSKEIAGLVADFTVHPQTKRPYTLSMIEKLMTDIHFSVHPTKSAKQQALEVIKVLQEKQVVPIARVQMRIRLTMPSKDAKKIKERLLGHFDNIEEQDWSEELEVIGTIDPGRFRELSDLIQDDSICSKGKGRLEVLNLKDIVD